MKKGGIDQLTFAVIDLRPVRLTSRCSSRVLFV